MTKRERRRQRAGRKKKRERERNRVNDGGNKRDIKKERDSK